ncbi:BglG family transcription antiterminator [Fusibacter paucivorans]|uniref:BglG family transcription antiterminator n=1 Tax=Fusibacter paucivorans TaxID=76009 RepID=A0ABS5PK72_9FIRM|nr:BglG family transcription antiterminator [Fusibacter paucivorans]MBS7525560.1 BglG family transcription antiterminator [Fusibacter paucivorans]
MDYSRRVIEIIEILLETENYIAIAAIAEKLNVSRRTIFREMEAVEAITAELGMTLSKKTRLGLSIAATSAQRERFKTEFARKADVHFDQAMRQNVLIVELLKSREPQKFFYFANMLSVSEATISYDMDKIEPWFNKREIELIRKPGFGVYLEGSETQFRKAIVDFLYQHYEHQELVALLETGLYQENMVEALIDRDVLIKVTTLLRQYETLIARRLTDAAYMGLLIHLAIAIQRTARGERIRMNPELLKELQRDAHYEMAGIIGQSIQSKFNIVFPEDELGYITMHLKGSKLKTAALVDENDVMISNYEISKLASKMMAVFKSESGYDFSDDERLLVGLVSHLKPALTRMKLHLDIRNPLLDKIKEMYPEIFNMSLKTTVIIRDRFDVEVPEAEVGYIAMHFGAAIERFRKAQIVQRDIRIGVVCSSGIGTSSLLYSRLSKLFPKLTIAAQFSKEDILLGKADVYGVELLISTIALEKTTVPVVIVNPLLLEDDEARIAHVLKMLNNQPGAKISAPPKEHNDRAQVQWIHDVTESVLTLEAHFKLVTDLHAKSLSQIIKQIAESYAGEFRTRKKLERQFQARERLGSTIIHGEGLMLLHTRSEIFDSVCFSVWRLNNAVNVHKDVIENVIVMGMPEQRSSIQSDMMSQLSKAIIEDDLFLNQIKHGDEASIKAYINTILQRWLNKQLQKGGPNDL